MGETAPQPALEIRPLDELKVVEASSGIAAAYATKLLAQAGASVFVVEGPDGHPLRHRRPTPSAEKGLLFGFLSEGKSVRSVRGGAEAAALFDEADIVVTDGAASRWGWSAPAGRGEGPTVVSISPWGLGGPWADRPASEITLQAACGSIGRRGLPGREPVMAGGALSEWVTGAYAAAVSAAFWCGLGGGAGGLHLDVSALECATLSFQPFAMIEADFRGRVHQARRSPAIPSVEPTADGFVGFSTITAQQFRDFLVMVEQPELADDPSLLDYAVREERRDELLSTIHAWTTKHDTEEIVSLSSAMRIPVAPIGNGQNLLSVDHMVERDVFQRGDHGVKRPRRPYRIHDGPGDSGTPANRPTSAGQDGAVRVPQRQGIDPEQPLRGLKVADFSAFWAGPAATHLLASLGADVIKIESVQRPDGMRMTTGRPDHERWWEWGFVFHGVNANKRAVTLDLGDRRGRELAERLLSWADVTIENFSPRVLDSFGLGWEHVSQINPRIVMVRMPAFGLTGPWRDRTGFAMTVEQASGLAWQTGYPDGPPMDVGGMCDPLSGMHAVVALLDGLSRRESTGRGCLVEVPLVEVAITAAAEQLVQFSSTGDLVGRMGNRDSMAAPQGVYPCKGEDEWLALSVTSDEQWERLRATAGLPEWADDPALGDLEARLVAHDRIDRELARWCAGSSSDQAADRLVAAGVPAWPVRVPATVRENPQLLARGFFEELEHPVIGPYRLPSLPFRLVGRERHWLRTAPPTLGQHNREVLSGMLGLDEPTIDSLAVDRVIGEAP